MIPAPDPSADRGTLRSALSRCRPVFLTLVGFSAALHLLGLAGPLFSLQVFDRVLSGRSLTTLGLLVVITVFLLMLQALIESLRSRVLVRAGFAFDDRVAAPAFGRMIAAGVTAPRDRAQANTARDLDTVRETLAGPAAIALLDAPFIPIYLIICFLLHPLIGLLVLTSGILLAGLAWLNGLATASALRRAQDEALAAAELAQTAHARAETVQALGMSDAVRRAWTLRRDAGLGWQALASDRSGGLQAVGRLVRALLPVGATGVGAWLVLDGQITAGVLVAASMLAARSLLPIDQLVTAWRGVQSARLAWERLAALEGDTASPAVRTPLPPAKGRLEVLRLVAVPHGSNVAALKGVSFALEPGQSLGVIGASGSGKSTLARVLLGLLPPLAGEVRLDGARLNQRDPITLGRDIGYLPQDGGLFAGTAAENIARFDPQATAERVIVAARSAGAHEMILQLPQGYDTVLGDGGQGLSGGQKARIALARALYGDPAVLVLDEPNAALDSDGEAALIAALHAAKARGSAVVVTTHRLGVLEAMDHLLVLEQGQVRAYGPKDAVRAALTQEGADARARPQVVQGGRS